jgi:hypothetical protein
MMVKSVTNSAPMAPIMKSRGCQSAAAIIKRCNPQNRSGQCRARVITPIAIPTPNEINMAVSGWRSMLASIYPPAALTRDFTSAAVLENLAFASSTTSETCWVVPGAGFCRSAPTDSDKRAMSCRSAARCAVVSSNVLSVIFFIELANHHDATGTFTPCRDWHGVNGQFKRSVRMYACDLGTVDGK